MLKQYPMLRYVLQKAFWYLLTFVVAVAINFTLPRMGENNPVDIIMGKAAQGLSPEEAKLKKEGLLKAFPRPPPCAPGQGGLAYAGAALPRAFASGYSPKSRGC